MSPSIAFLKSRLGNDLGKFAKDRGLKITPVVVLYEQRDGRSKVVGSATTSIAGVADPYEHQRSFHGVALNRRSVSELIVRNVVIIQKDSFFVPYPNGFHCISMDEVPETLRDSSK